MDRGAWQATVHGILQARILEWVPFPSPGDLPDPGIEPRSPAFQGDSLPTELGGKVINSFRSANYNIVNCSFGVYELEY